MLTLLPLLALLAGLLRRTRLLAGLPLLALRPVLRPFRHLLRQLLQLPPQRFLVARETLESTRDGVRVERVLVARQIVLLATQRLLPSGELAELREGVVVRVLVLPRLRRGGVLVGRLLLFPQFLIEQRRHVGRIAIAAPATAALLSSDLPALHLGLRPEQQVERLELMRHRRGGLQPVQFRRRAAHRFDGHAHRVVAHATEGRRPSPSARLPIRGLQLVAGFLGRALFERTLRLREGPDVGRRLPVASAAPAAVELPRRDDNLLLGRREILHALRLRPSGHGLALSRNELLVERLDLQEVHVAASLRRRLPAADVPGPREIRHEVAWRHLEVLEQQQVGARERQSASCARQRHDHFRIARLLQDELEAAHAEIVVRSHLDLHLFERRHLLVAAGTQHAHVGWTIQQSADEVLGVVRRLHAVVDHRDAVRPIGGDRQRARCADARHPERHPRAIGKHERPGVHRADRWSR